MPSSKHSTYVKHLIITQNIRSDIWWFLLLETENLRDRNVPRSCVSSKEKNWNWNQVVQLQCLHSSLNHFHSDVLTRLCSPEQKQTQVLGYRLCSLALLDIWVTFHTAHIRFHWKKISPHRTADILANEAGFLYPSLFQPLHPRFLT